MTKFHDSPMLANIPGSSTKHFYHICAQVPISGLGSAHSIPRILRQVEESRQQLGRLRQLMTSVEEAHASGQRLSEAVPYQLTELLASASQLSSQPASADSEPADDGPGTDRPREDGQRSVGSRVKRADRSRTEVTGQTELPRAEPR